MLPPLVKVKGLTFKYVTAKVPALQDISFSVNKGEFVCITGPSGCGKSTLALTLAGFIPHMYRGNLEGDVFVDGHNTRDMSPGALAGTVGLVQQDPEAQLCTLTVIDEVAFGPENLCLPQKEIQGRVKWALAATGATNLLHRNVYTLSGGEKQRVAVASVLAMTPKLLILDEPTANLDPRATARILDIIQSLRYERDMAIIVIEHRLHRLLPYTDRLITMDQGRIIEDSAPDQIFFSAAYDADAGHAGRGQSCAKHKGDTGDTSYVSHASDAETVGYQGDGVGAKQAVDARDTRPGAVPTIKGQPYGMLSVSNLTVEYDGRKALDNVSFSLYPGEIVAVMGDNGSGKTTLLSALLGLIQPTTGTIELYGKDISGLRIAERASIMGLSFQNPNHQITESTVWQEVELPKLNFGVQPDVALSPTSPASDSNAQNAARSTQSKARKLHRMQGNENQRPEPDLSRILLDFGLSEHRDQNPFALSHGQKKRLNIASLLGYMPHVLLLDEPMVGQDPARQSIIVKKLREFSEGGGLVIMVCHEPSTISRCCTRALFFQEGTLLVDEPLDSAFAALGAMGRTEYLPPALHPACSAEPRSGRPGCRSGKPRTGILPANQELVESAGAAAPGTGTGTGTGLFGLGYVPGRSLLHQMNPLVKMVLLAAFTITVFAVKFLPWQFILFLLMLSGYGLAGLGPGFFVSKARMILRFCFFILLIQVIFWHEGHIVWFFSIAGLRVSVWSEGLIRGAGISLRFLNVVGSSYLFVSVTNPNQMAYALMQAGLPYRYGFMLITSLRFIPLFKLELTQIRNAQMAKGIDLQDKSLKGLARQVRHTFLPLLVSALEKVDALTMSMEGRAFGLHPTRTYRVAYRVSKKGALLLTVALAVLTCLMAVSLISR